MTEDLWRSGAFADAYMVRNADAGARRHEFWLGRVLGPCPTTSVLEVGCNVGANLQHIAPVVPRVVGVDINVHALAAAQLIPNVTAVHAPATALPFVDASFDLVFTSGVLIHLDHEQLPRAMDEMVRVSRRFLLAIEYFAPTEVEVPYRGHAGALWKRPYDLFFALRFPHLVPAGQGWLGPNDGWDDCNWWLWEKR